ncbi:MAG: portal protein [Desulfovibrionaceae bacterium]
MAEPNTIPKTAPKTSAELGEFVEARLKSLEALRAPWEPVWADLADYFMPRKAGQFRGERSPGRAGDDRIYDSTPGECLLRLGGNLGALLTNPNQEWFGARHKDQRRNDDSRVKGWLAECVEGLGNWFASDRTGFQTGVCEFYLDWPLFGTAPFYVEADPKSVVRFTARPLAEVYAAENWRGEVDTVFRRVEMDAVEVVAEWPHSCPRELREKAAREPHAVVRVVHAVFPRRDRNPGAGLGAGDFPFASVYLLPEPRTVLEESGFLELPYMLPRWAKIPREVWGRGPGLSALADVRVLNAMGRTALLAGEKMADPPLMVPDDDFLGPVRTGPGGLSYYRSGSSDRIEPLPVAVDLRAVEAMMEQKRQAIRAMLFVDAFDTGESPAKTATQVLVEDGRKMTALGGMLARAQAEFLGPLLRRVWGIARRAGELPEPPNGVSLDDVELHYTSPLARAQRQESARAVAMAVELLAPFIGKDDPFGVMDNYDTDKVTRGVNEAVGTPPEYLRAEDEVAKGREGRQQAAAGDRALAEARELAGAAADAGKAGLLPGARGGA